MDTTTPTKHITQITITHDNPSAAAAALLEPIGGGDATSDREMKPKFVVGTKKYGRRSRPSSDVLDVGDSEDADESDPTPGSNETYYVSSGTSEEEQKRNKVQRSASQSDIHGTKRKRPLSASRLKRCASLPPQRLIKPGAARKKGTTFIALHLVI